MLDGAKHFDMTRRSATFRTRPLTLPYLFSKEKGSATVPVAPVGVLPTGSLARPGSVNGAAGLARNGFGETPKTAGETPALPQPTESRPPRCSYSMDLGGTANLAVLGGTLPPSLGFLGH